MRGDRMDGSRLNGRSTHREFVYTGDPIPNLDAYPDFLTGLQKSMLHSLVKRGLLTSDQIEQVVRKLKPQIN